MKNSKSKSIGIRNKSLTDAETLSKLKDLGKLHVDFKDEDLLIELLSHTSKDIRYYSIINLAKLQNEALLEIFTQRLRIEETSRNRREISSAIGRMRSSWPPISKKPKPLSSHPN